MTHLAAHIAAECGAPAGRVLGSGTTLDTAPVPQPVGGFCGVDPHHVHGYVLGEHGDSEVLTWSLVTVAGMPLKSSPELRRVEVPAAAQEIDRPGARRGRADHRRQGRDLLRHRQRPGPHHRRRAARPAFGADGLRPAADVLGVRDVTVSLPRLVGGAGIIETFPLPLSEEEQAQLRRSAEVIRKCIDETLGGAN